MNDDPSLTQFLAQALAPFVGVAAAALWAPQLLIIASAGAGAYVGLLNSETTKPLRAVALWFAFTLCGWLFAHLLASAFVWVKLLPSVSHPLTMGCALCIGWVGDRWPELGSKAGKKLWDIFWAAADKLRSP